MMLMHQMMQMQRWLFSGFRRRCYALSRC